MAELIIHTEEIKNNIRNLSRFFKEQRVSAEIIDKKMGELELESVFNRFKANLNSSVLITQEGFIDQAPPADVLIYYDLSLDQQAVEKRFVSLQQQYTAHPPIFVHFLSKDSLEYGLHQMIEENEALYEEIEQFLLQKEDDLELSRDAQNKLKSVLQNLYKERFDGPRKDEFGQTLLFPVSDDIKPLSLSGEEHKAFESPKIEKKNT